MFGTQTIASTVSRAFGRKRNRVVGPIWKRKHDREGIIGLWARYWVTDHPVLPDHEDTGLINGYLYEEATDDLWVFIRNEWRHSTQLTATWS